MTEKIICDCCGKELLTTFGSSYLYYRPIDHYGSSGKHDLCVVCTHKVLKLIGKEK